MTNATRPPVRTAALADYVAIEGFRVARTLYDFCMNEALRGTVLDTDVFWAGLAELVRELGPRHAKVLEVRETLQAAIDGWHRARTGQTLDEGTYRGFLEEIGYLVPEGAPFTIDPRDVDAEVATVAGPQLVVPVMNARSTH